MASELKTLNDQGFTIGMHRTVGVFHKIQICHEYVRGF